MMNEVAYGYVATLKIETIQSRKSHAQNLGLDLGGRAIDASFSLD